MWNQNGVITGEAYTLLQLVLFIVKVAKDINNGSIVIVNDNY